MRPSRWAGWRAPPSWSVRSATHGPRSSRASTTGGWYAQGLRGGTMGGYVCALGLEGLGGALDLRLLLPPGADLGTGVVGGRRSPAPPAGDGDHSLHPAGDRGRPRRRGRAPSAWRTASAAEAVTAVLADLRVAAHHDPVLHTTVLDVDAPASPGRGGRRSTTPCGRQRPRAWWRSCCWAVRAG